MNIKHSILKLLVLSIILISHDVLASTATPANIYTEDKLTISPTPQRAKFTIKLKSNPTTGYAWSLREYDRNLIKLVKHSFQAPTGKLMGAPGYELWTFKVKPKGFVGRHQTTIRFVYARAWRSNDPSTEIVFKVST